MSKSILVIGLGRFGVYLTKKFFELGDEVMAVDIDEEKIQEIMPYVVGAKIANCRNPETLRSIGVGDFDLCFVCIGTNFQSSLEITCLLKELGAKKVISKANNEFHAKFLERNGADKVVYPEKYSAGKLAIKYSSDKVIDYIELTSDIAIYEIPVPCSWSGKTIEAIGVRKKYNINILAIKKSGNQDIKVSPGPEYTFGENELAIVLGEKEDVDRVISIKK